MFPAVALIVLLMAGNAFVAWCCLYVGSSAERDAETTAARYAAGTKERS
ncbi:hypothetical protein [Adlercreutzia sp. ZJ473]|nr:hypothetical protein [Adlercreutzia sp. ZJ473]